MYSKKSPNSEHDFFEEQLREKNIGILYFFKKQAFIHWPLSIWLLLYSAGK